MEENKTTDLIRNIAVGFDRAIETRDIEAAVAYFADDCLIEVLGLELDGKDGARKWMNWLLERLAEIKIELGDSALNGNTLFEEYTLKAKGRDGTRLNSRQTEVITVQDGKIKSLRIYFDRFDFADLVARGFLAKTILQEITRVSLRGLED